MPQLYGSPEDIQDPNQIWPGQIEAPTLDPALQPTVRNPDGTESTVRSIGIEQDGRHVLIPTVHPKGRIMDNEEAIRQYLSTGNHLGHYDSQENADAAAQRLHESEAKRISDDNHPVVKAFDNIVDKAFGRVTPEELGRITTQQFGEEAGQLFEKELRGRHENMAKAFSEGKARAEASVPYLRKYLPKHVADFLEEAIKYAPMAFPAGRGAGGLGSVRLGSPPRLPEMPLKPSKLPEGVSIEPVSENSRQANFDIKHDGEDIGRAYVRILPNRIQIGNIDIAEPFQRKGIATELTRMLEDKYKVPAVPDMTLSNAEYSRWQKIDPQALRYHKNLSKPGEEPYWHSDQPDVMYTDRYVRRLTQLSKDIVAGDTLQGANVRADRAHAAGEKPISVPKKGEQSGIMTAEATGQQERRMSMPATGTLEALYGLTGGPEGKWPPPKTNTNMTEEQMFKRALDEQNNAWIIDLARRSRLQVIKPPPKDEK